MKGKGRPENSRPRELRTLYLIRHAIAEERGPQYPDDDLRPLTKRGMDKMREAVRGFAELRPNVNVVVTSPLVRAKQTAEIVVAGLAPAPVHEVLDELAPGHSPAELAEALEPYRKHQTIALVGHEPDLGEFAAWLIGSTKPIPFKKGGIACLEISDLPPGRTNTLIWLATPKMLRGLG
jgi:phosphohistidine phosphatase